ncbi:helicase associated domain-containing protein, partial [Streptomyces sp. NPDC058572]|uniref:helicase associated domain-containing protein n=1 Tax=Streptomyces sp. NPDC058572 TaxID=3346546 RepID=UPI003665A5E2
GTDGADAARHKPASATTADETTHRDNTGCSTGPAEKPAAPATKRRASGGAFERGIAALAQYVEREGRTVVPRGHTEHLPDGTPVRLGVWLSNTRTRRTTLNPEQRQALTELGINWT